MKRLEVVVFPALAMCLGWGIRGQFGGESGAMVPGALVGLSLALLSGWQGRDALRLAAVGAFACSFGGMMTYGQTLGLVHGQYPSPTYWWGMLGLAVKGGVWIGLTGAFLAMACSERYRWREVVLLLVGLLVLGAVGVQVLNRPHNPPHELPLIYFSQRDAVKPRMEWWGGLWFALIGLVVYALYWKRQTELLLMTIWGVLGGAIGFCLGEALQAWGMHHKPFGEKLHQWIDWWKVMEVTFGFVAGASIGLGWRQSQLHRHAPPTIVNHSGIWEIVTLVLWAAPIIAIDAGVSWAQPLDSLPSVWMVLGLAGSLIGTAWAPFCIGVGLPLVSASETIRYLWQEKQLLFSVWAGTGLVGIVGFAAWLTWRWNTEGVPLRYWWTWTLWSQTLLTIFKVMLPLLLAESPQSWAARIGSAGVVEAGFVLLAVVLSLLSLKLETNRTPSSPVRERGGNSGG